MNYEAIVMAEAAVTAWSKKTGKAITVTVNGETSYTEEAQEVFNRAYDEATAEDFYPDPGECDACDIPRP